MSQLLFEGPAHVNVPWNFGTMEPQQLAVLRLVKFLVIKILEDLPTLLRPTQATVEFPCVVGVAPAEGVAPESSH